MAEDIMTPVSGAEPPPANPIARPQASTLKLKPVIRKPGAARPTIGPVGAKPPAPPPAENPAAPAAAEGSAMEQLKTVTQKLKGVTQQIPQQAILRKTGIISDQDFSEAQKQAAKSRTARISLSDALGVAPVQNEAAPMKTIRIKRPESISKPADSVTAPGSMATSDGEPAGGEAAATPITQRKTLKISRPGAVRPAGKFGVKKTDAPEAAAAPAEGEVADMTEVADIPDMPASQPKFSAPAVPVDALPDVSKGVNIASILVQIAACAVIGFLGYCLYQDAQLPLFCGGCGWAQ